MDMFYLDKEMQLPLKTQEDLDRAVQMAGCGNGVNGLLRVLLKTPKNNHYLQVNTRDKQSEMRSSRSLGDLKGSLLKGNERVRKHSTGSLHTGRTSPPPGSVPEEQQQIARQGSCTSIHSEGEFIPETLDQNELQQKVTEAFDQQMDMFYLDKEMQLPLKTQEDLDRAVQMAGCGNGVNGLLRVLLKTPKNNHYLQVNTRDKQSEMRSSRSLGDLKGSLLKGNERVRKHSTGASVETDQQADDPGRETCVGPGVGEQRAVCLSSARLQGVSGANVTLTLPENEGPPECCGVEKRSQIFSETCAWG
ncbi:hypothetical protein CRUP_014154 [Coryphaenoides rupestris]|nr:hypothetical protein CRUP_014154 [Coryphaenoides rupestris]